MSEENKIQSEDELWAQLSEPVAEKSEPKAAKPKAEPRFAKPEPAKSPRKIDGFFLGCMAGVAAISVAVTMMFGGNGASAPVSGGSSNDSAVVAELERENAELRAQLELQKEQVKKLQSDLLALMGSEEYLDAVGENEGTSDSRDAQLAALDTFAQIQAAYAEFDREKLEELIPQMDQQLSYLSPEALNSYYMILEYVEQPSNG